MALPVQNCRAKNVSLSLTYLPYLRLKKGWFFAPPRTNLLPHQLSSPEKRNFESIL